MDKIASLVDLFAKIDSRATFLSIRGYKSKNNEISNFIISFHFSYLNALNKSLLLAEAFEPMNDIQNQAKQEILSSIALSIEGHKESTIEENDRHFIYFNDKKGNLINGIKMHEGREVLYLYGLVVKKETIISGREKIVNKKPLTIAKDLIRSNLPISRFSMFIIESDKFDCIYVNGAEIHSKIE
jgi:hypothetical protein